jgi:hypothetical protein
MTFARHTGRHSAVARHSIWAAALMIAACVTTSGSLSNSAERLERSAYDLHADARDERLSSSYSRDAQDLAQEARDFRHTIEDHRASDRDKREAFADLSRSYHALRDEVEHSRDREAELDLKPVTDAYLDIEREMRRYGERDRYARDD